MGYGGYIPLLTWVIPGNKICHSLCSAVPFLSSNAVCGQAKWAVVKKLNAVILTIKYLKEVLTLGLTIAFKPQHFNKVSRVRCFRCNFRVIMPF